MVAVVSAKEDVASQALILLGEPKISSFDEDESGVVEATYERIVQAQLSGTYKWRFCREKKQLTRSATAPANEWTYAYDLDPNRMGYPTAVFNSLQDGATPIPGNRFEIFGQQLYTHEEIVVVDQRVRPVEAQWPAYFVQLIVYACAAEWAEAIAEDEDKGRIWSRAAFGAPEEEGLGGYSRTARSADASVGGIQQVQHFALTDARRS